MQQNRSFSNAVIAGKDDLFYAETREVWEPLLQRPLSDEECENLSAQFVDFITFLGNISQAECSKADNGATA